MGMLAPGYPTFEIYKGPQPSESIVNGAAVVIPVTGTKTTGDTATITPYVNGVGGTPLTYTVLVGDPSLAAVCTKIAAVIQAAITAATTPWVTDYASAAAVGQTITVPLTSDDLLPNVALIITWNGGATEITPATGYPVLEQGLTVVTALSTFPYAGPNGAITVYIGQEIILDYAAATELLDAGLVE